MRVLNVVPFFAASQGGVVTAVRHLSRALAQAGDDVTILTSDYQFDEEYVNATRSAKIEVAVIPIRARAGLYLYTPEMKKWLNRNLPQFDVVHLHDLRSYQNHIVHYYSREKGKRFVLQAHGSLPRDFGKSNLKRLYDLVWGRRILRHASRVIALTQQEARQYRQAGIDEGRIRIVPNGIDLTEIPSGLAKGEFKKRYGIPEEERIVLYLGRLHRIKRIDMLVNAFSKIADEKIRLVIAGPDDGHEEAIRKCIDELGLQSKTTLTGPLYGSSKWQAYTDADVYVLPSEYEAFPMTVLEAWSCRTHVIVTEACAISELVRRMGDLVVEPNEVALCRAISRIVHEDDRSMDDERLRLLGDYSWPVIAKKFQAIYRECLD